MAYKVLRKQAICRNIDTLNNRNKDIFVASLYPREMKLGVVVLLFTFDNQILGWLSTCREVVLLNFNISSAGQQSVQKKSYFAAESSGNSPLATVLSGLNKNTRLFGL